MRRWVAYVVLVEIAFLGTGWWLDASYLYSKQTAAAHVMAGVFGVFAVLLGGVVIAAIMTNVALAYLSARRGQE